jgi:hypothetical protein
MSDPSDFNGGRDPAPRKAPPVDATVEGVPRYTRAELGRMKIGRAHV